MAARSTTRAHEPPLTPVVFHILLALSEGALHGYAIMQAVEETGGPALATGPGTIYGSLARMEESGLVREVPLAEVPDTDDGPRRGRPRRYFGLTAAGDAALASEAARLERLAGIVRDRHLLPDESGS